jgi:hypothetical protein
VQSLPLPRMGLSSHLEGVMNGTFLVVLGLVWPHLRLRALLLRAAYWLALVGAYFNWAVTLAAAAWGAGGATMPLVAGGHLGTPDQELILLVDPVAHSGLAVRSNSIRAWEPLARSLCVWASLPTLSLLRGRARRSGDLLPPRQ